MRAPGDLALQSPVILQAALTCSCYTLFFRGDVILWHHRTAHMAGQNYGTNIRQAVLFDFIKKEEFYDDSAPPEDMWRDWSAEIRELDEDLGSLGEAARM